MEYPPPYVYIHVLANRKSMKYEEGEYKEKQKTKKFKKIEGHQLCQKPARKKNIFTDNIRHMPKDNLHYCSDTVIK